MNGMFSIIPLPRLLALMLKQISQGHIFGIPRELFFKPSEKDPFRTSRHGNVLETPLGAAAGPHTQLAQNIVSAWLCGARYIELKTIQTLDNLEVSKPCIDMQDEGYNCEWSQELRIQESYDQYLNAWILVHCLGHILWGKDHSSASSSLQGGQHPGGLFNMSVGYNLNGIRQENVQWFLRKMQDCSSEKELKINEIRRVFPEIDEIVIPDLISDNITLSTMHGCPAGEIEEIGRYLLEEKRLHTTIKLNPTLLGPTELRNILNSRLKWPANVPDSAFEHDLKYPDALALVRSLNETAAAHGLFFGLKLTNTLEVVNHKKVFPAGETAMYMSGRALHPVSIAAARKLRNDLGPDISISFSAGTDCFNVPEVLACGLSPVTVCSDLLKPGGYGRLAQYLENLREEFNRSGALNPDDFILKKNQNQPGDPGKAAADNLNDYADRVCNDGYYRKDVTPDLKSARKLDYFDCIKAPCVNNCPANQDIPEYLYQTSVNDIAGAFRVILQTNPFPSVLGMVCDHICQTQCTRVCYDRPLMIREVKRFVAESQSSLPPSGRSAGKTLKAAIIGAGPAGLSCAFFLALEGFQVDVFESKSVPGGMVSEAIPAFRLSASALQRDIRRIEELGVSIRCGEQIDRPRFERMRSVYDYIYVAVGAGRTKKQGIEGEGSAGVLDPVEFLSEVKKKRPVSIGPEVVVIGGGNTAMDAARTAKRLVGKAGNVTILYRRGRQDMPAGREEVAEALSEGIHFKEWTVPEKILETGGRVNGLLLARTEAGATDRSGRPAPVKVAGSEFIMKADTILPALGQEVVIDFADAEMLRTDPESLRTRMDRVFLGGDALRGASTIVKAVGDGKKAAMAIIGDYQKNDGIGSSKLEKGSRNALLARKARRDFGETFIHSPGEHTGLYEAPPAMLNAAQAVREASRCLYCDEVCDLCVTVCPNRANYGYYVQPLEYRLQKVLHENGEVTISEDKIFRIGQQYQVLNLGEFCNECGNCTTFCPTAGSPFRDKPRVYLTIQAFREADSGFFMNSRIDCNILIYKEKNQIRTLTEEINSYIYETDQVRVTLGKENFRIIDFKALVPCVKNCYLTFAAEMSVVLQGLKELA